MRSAAAARVTPDSLLALKRSRIPIVMVTAYDVVSGAAARAAGVDVVLVGDSAANVVLGYESTREITLGEMLTLAAAVRRGVDREADDRSVPLLVGDLPFGTYETSDAQAVASARRFVHEARCDAVKLEGGGAMAARARAIIASGIPVMGHVGLLPQHVEAGDKHEVQGRTAARALDIARQAHTLEEAGCFSIVFEALPTALATLVVPRLRIPVIGIGAGADVDGQVLVLHDLLGLHQGRQPRFVKQYAALFDAMTTALGQFASDVRSRAYPEPGHGYGMDETELRQVRDSLGSTHGRAR